MAPQEVHAVLNPKTLCPPLVQFGEEQGSSCHNWLFQEHRVPTPDVFVFIALTALGIT